MASEVLAAWLLTVALHTTLLLGLAWLVDRGALRARPAWREVLWRAAFFGGVISASAQVLLHASPTASITLPTNASATSNVASHLSLSTTSSDHGVAPSGRDAMIAHTQDSSPDATDSVAARASRDRRSSASGRIARVAHLIASALPAWPMLLIAGWLAGALIAVGRLAIALLRLRHSLQHMQPVTSVELSTDVAAFAIQAGIVTPRLAALDDLASPIAAHGRRIVLPGWAVELLEHEQLRAMLAHETAHIARRDPAWKIAIATWCALFWFMPLAPLARRKLDEIAEISCDAWAAIHLGDGRSLAECLAECAERRVGGLDFSLASAMAGRDSPLLQRIDYLIAGIPMNMQAAGARAVFAAAIALALAAFALPGVGLESAVAQIPPPPPAVPAAPAPPAAPAAAKGHHNIRISSDNDSGRDILSLEVNDGQRGYRVRIFGKIEFNANEDDVASLDAGGTASFAETRGGHTQRIDVANRDGKLERRYFIDDSERPLDDETRKWMATLIPSVIRETAIDAAARVKHLRAKGGADLVLDEIGRIESDFARAIYLRELLAGGKLTSLQTTRALGLVDHMSSDYERRNALSALASAQPLDAEQQKLVLTQATKIGSDYERAELLVGMLPTLAPAPDVHAAWLAAAAAIGSDYEHRRVLAALLDAGPVDEAALSTILDEAQTIGSDSERRSLLTEVMQRTRSADALAPAYATAAAKIGSDYERREALLALIRAPGFGKTGARAVLDVVPGIGSDYERREVLVALARVMPDDGDLIARYHGITARLSDSERGEAERALKPFAG